MKLLDEKDLAAELAIDQAMLTIADGRTAPPSDMVVHPFEKNPSRENTDKLMKLLFKDVPDFDPELAKKVGMSNWSGDQLSDAAILKIVVMVRILTK